ncbi:MAG: hypothetical protein KIT23_08320, partial [Sphingopyxis sp.]|nr:hypothetical protein [Sphingopyxis sp.]
MTMRISFCVGWYAATSLIQLTSPNAVRPELVEGPFFLLAHKVQDSPSTSSGLTVLLLLRQSYRLLHLAQAGVCAQ